ncbi:ABC transporter substrate-binding protein [Streptomyces sp. NPDC059224]|uniref:ABC transporter substrate-binding protein n=1 Tax=Streptomyces sp. NPDC059224 TaxID=3346775 RepID=UPI0036D114BE
MPKNPAPWQPGGTPQTRRSVLRAVGATGAALSLGGTLAGCGATDDPAAGRPSSTSTARPATLRVALGWIKNVEFAGFWIADSAGYYAEENLSVQFQPGGPNTPDSTQLLATGSADIGVHANMQTLLQAITKGNDFVMAGSGFQTNPGGLVSLASAPVTRPRDLLGAKVLGQQGSKPQLDAILELAGLRKDFDFIPVGFDVGPLVEKQGKVLTCYLTSQPIALESKYGMKKGKDYQAVTYESMGLPAYASIVYCHRKFLDGQRDVMQRFLRASIRGWQENARDPERAARLAVEKYGADLGLDLKQQIRENEVQIPFTENALTRRKGLFRMDTQRLGGPMYAALRASGVKSLPDAGKVVDQSVLDEIYGSRNRI